MPERFALRTPRFPKPKLGSTSRPTDDTYVTEKENWIQYMNLLDDTCESLSAVDVELCGTNVPRFPKALTFSSPETSALAVFFL